MRTFPLEKKGKRCKPLETGSVTERQISLIYYMIKEDVFAARKACGWVRMGEILHIPVSPAVAEGIWVIPPSYKLIRFG